MHFFYDILRICIGLPLMFINSLLPQGPPPPPPPPLQEADWRPLSASLCGQYPYEFSSAERAKFVHAINVHDEAWLLQCQDHAIQAGFQPYLEHEMVRQALYSDGNAASVVELLGPKGLQPTPETLLHAVFTSDVLAIQALFKMGAEPNGMLGTGTHDLECVFHRAASSSPPEVIEVFLEVGVDLNLRSPQQYEGGPLRWLNAYDWSLKNKYPKSRELLKNRAN